MPLPLIDLIFGLLQAVIGMVGPKGEKLHPEIIAAAQKAVDAFMIRKDDPLTKENFEAQRG